MKDYTITRAQFSDLQEIHDLLYEYYKESAYTALTWDEIAVKNHISTLDFPIVARNKCGILGIVSLVVHRTWFKEPIAELEIFYVKPEFRGTGLSRDLVSTVLQIADAEGAAAFHASTISGTDSTLFSNLLKKYGFEVIGVELIRKS